MRMKPASKTLIALLLGVLLTGNISSFGIPEGRSQERTKVIIDTDIGEDIDDILVTAFALNSPEFEVLAITTVDGNVEARTRIARKLATFYGQPQIPIAAGYVRSMPLADITYTGSSGGVRYGEIAPEEQELLPVSPLRADALIAELANQHPGEITVVTIGSMSNIGHFLVRYPDAAKKLKQIVTNGGRFTTRQQQIGWNLRYDPVAAVITARSEVPWVLLSESTSRYCGLRLEDVDRLRNAGLPTTTLLSEAIHWWKMNKADATRLPHVSDLNVFAYLLGGWVETVRGKVFIEIGPRGSLPGFRVEEDPRGRILLGKDIPKEKAAVLRDIFMERLVSRPVRRDRSTGRASTSATARRRGWAKAEVTRPKHFPHRIWAACDFEARTRDYGWFGPAQTENILPYPGNTTALGVGARPYQNFSAIMTGINPVPGPRMGKINYLYLRYYLIGSSQATFQHFSLTSNDNNHIRVSGLTGGRWSEVTLNFTRDGRRNDGTPGIPFKEGERMDDLKVFVGKPGDGKNYDLFIDDAIFFSEDPELEPEPEPFPNRVIFLAAFDTGPKEQYWPGEFQIEEKNLPKDSYWRVARAVPREEDRGKWIRLRLDPVRQVGEHTKLRFRYHLVGSARMTVQIFDLTDMDNRHIRLDKLEQGKWETIYLDFTRDAKRNDGSETPFAAGHKVDDIFFFVEPDGSREVDLLIDEVVLFDANSRNPTPSREADVHSDTTP